MSYFSGKAGPAPELRSPALADARELFARFHCFPAQRIVRQPCPRTIPPVLTALGELCGVIYRSDRGQRGCARTFVHLFETPPQLASDPAGTQLYVLGGTYRVTRRGLEG